MKVLVLGAGGMAGHVMAMRLAELGHSVTGLARRKLDFCETIIADVRSLENLKIITNYDAVVNCAGALNKAVDAEPDVGIWLNSCLPHLLARLTDGAMTKIIHLSTDCVFSGRGGGNYREGDFRSADTFYGRSKALGELIDGKNLTFRTSIVGPDINKSGVGLFNWFMKQNGTVNGYTGAIWSGVSSITLANAADAALRQNLTGLCHLVNNHSISKFELLKLFNTLRKIPVEIAPSDALLENKSLINTRADFDFTVPGYAEMVLEIGEWMGRHNYEQ